MNHITNELILHQIPGCIAWKDKDLKYLGANDHLILTMKLQYSEQLIGLTDKELNLNSPENNELFEQQDNKVLADHHLEVIHGLDAPDNDKTYFLKKSPLKDEQGLIIGLIYHCSPWPQEDLLQSLQMIDQKNQFSTDIPSHYNFDNHHNPVELSTRELECLFLQLRGKTAKETGNILSLSKRTVESYIDNIKTKFGCLNKAELLVSATSHGYQNHVPKTLLNMDLKKVL